MTTSQFTRRAAVAATAALPVLPTAAGASHIEYADPDPAVIAYWQWIVASEECTAALRAAAIEADDDPRSRGRGSAPGS